MKAHNGRRLGFIGLPSIAMGVGFALSILIIASASAAPSTSKGRIPAAAFLSNGELDARLVPDFVSAYGRDGISIAGYVPKEYLLHTNMEAVSKQLPKLPDIPVYGEDLKTLVGHMIPGKGFVPLGVDPASVPMFGIEQGAG